MRLRNCVRKVSENVAAGPDGPKKAADIVEGYVSRGGWLGAPADAITRERRETKLLIEAARAPGPGRRALAEAIGPWARPETAQKMFELQLTRAASAVERGAWQDAAADLAVAIRMRGANVLGIAQIQAAVQAHADHRSEAFYRAWVDAYAVQEPAARPLLEALFRVAVLEATQPYDRARLQDILCAVPAKHESDLAFWSLLLRSMTPTAFVYFVSDHPQAPALCLLALSQALLASVEEAQGVVDAAQNLCPWAQHAPMGTCLQHARAALLERECGSVAGFYRAFDAALLVTPNLVKDGLLASIKVSMRRDVADIGTAHHLIACLPQAPRLRREGEIALALLDTATQLGQNALRATLLDLGVGFVPPERLVWDMTPGFLSRVREHRWQILYYGTLNKADQCVLSPDFREPLHVYEWHDLPHGQEVESLRRLTDGGWSVLGARSREGSTRVLVCAGDAAIHDYRIERHPQFGAGLHSIHARGVRLVTTLSLGSSQTLYLVDYADKRRVEYRWKMADDVESALREALALGALPCAAGNSVAGKTKHLLFAHASDVASPVRSAMEDVDALSQSARSALVAGAWSRAALAIDRLPPATVHASPWVRHRQVFADVIAQRLTDPWHCMLTLAQTAIAEGSLDAMCAEAGEFCRDAARIIRLVWGDCSQSGRVQVLDQARTKNFDEKVVTVLAAAISDLLRDFNLNPPNMDCSNSDLLSYLLGQAIEHKDPSHAALLVCLGADPDEVVHTGTSPRQTALQLGKLWTCEALDGNRAAGRECFRMGPEQRRTLIARACAAHALSQAQTPALEARLQAMGEGPHAAIELRNYLRRRAPLWINFVPACTNGLLRAEAYTPRGGGNAAWANGYAQAAPRESGVIYGWVNAQKSLIGYTDFGDAALILKDHLRARITVTSRKRCSYVEAVGTLHAMDHVLMDLSDQTLRAFLAAMRGCKQERSGRVAYNDLIEMHIHGPLNMREDVRKIVVSAGARLSKEAHDALRDFSENNNLPIHWRGGADLSGDSRSAWLASLSRQSVDVAAWSFHAQETFLVRPGRLVDVDARGRHNYIYGEQHCHATHLAQTVATIGLSGEDIVGMHTSASSGGGKQAVFITRTHLRDRGARTYALYRTQLPKERLSALGAESWELMTCHRTGGDVSVTFDTFLVVRQSEKRWEYMWVSVAGNRRNAAYNVTAEYATDGWALAGMMQHSQGVGGRVLVLKRPLGAHAILSDAPAVPANVINDTTLMLSPLADVPEAFRFVTQDHYMFDIEELATLAEEKGALINGWTNSPLCEADIAAVLAHPSGAGARLASMVASNDVLLGRLRPATATALENLAEVLSSDPKTGDMSRSVQATHDFSRYVHGPYVSASERIAIYGAKFALVGRQGQAFQLSIMAAVAGLQTGAGCSIATGGYLKSMATYIRVAAAAN